MIGVGSAVPPTTSRGGLANLRDGSARSHCSSAVQMVGTPAEKVTRSASNSRCRLAGSSRAPGSTSEAPAIGRGIGDAPGIHVEHRHDRQHHILGADVEDVLLQHRQRRG